MSDPQDPQRRAYYARVARLERMHSRGYGFEAPGTLGRSYYTHYQRSSRRRVPVLRIAAVVAAALILMKALIVSQIGVMDYNMRLDRFGADTVAQRSLAYVMQVDPITAWLGAELHKAFAAAG
ncbi:hypothetical protein [Rhodovulum adriaticum]|uniref:Uncharacterized protein n=1 Tax=Rhodovulum adriaticum TaxID=35804 RepID=A0A4R2NK04_RHOAD|nr:hypothetical protein [Rhodovulum adriaticum]MBK1635584.1 hypothetical protein [Rhodovulum adriaticum]TCP21781.1 hypothetical protein EV656_10933 [Rhodovulum adriaticum]